MKYFTVELLNRFRSDDEDVSALAHVHWEEALKKYRRRQARIKPALPESLRRFVDDHVCLHDARLLKMGLHGATFVLILEKEPPSQDLVILTFTLDGEPQITDTPLEGKSDAGFVTWMYEEWELDRRQHWRIEVLLSNGWVVKLPFRDFQFLIVQQVMPDRNGRVAQQSSLAMPRSASTPSGASFVNNSSTVPLRDRPHPRTRRTAL